MFTVTLWETIKLTDCLLQLKIKSLCAISGLLCTVGPVVPYVMTEEAIDFIDLDILEDSF